MIEVPPIGVLMMAYGSPDSLDQMEEYLLDIRGGRATPPSLVEEIKERYARIGGRSPLLDLTLAQAFALDKELNRRHNPTGMRFRVYVGMRHWAPRIEEAAAQIVADGIDRLVALVMAPHQSRLSTGAYFRKLEEAIAELGMRPAIGRVESWHDHPDLIVALAEKAASAIARFVDGTPFVIFTAHSLPNRILAEGDPYDRQLRETAQLLAGRLSLAGGRWCFCYQSSGRSSEPWLGPQIEETILDLIKDGEKELLVVPIGFVCDHVEVLYDIDIAARELAEAHGARLERSVSLNSSPALISALADLVYRAVPQPAGTPAAAQSFP